MGHHVVGAVVLFPLCRVTVNETHDAIADGRGGVQWNCERSVPYPSESPPRRDRPRLSSNSQRGQNPFAKGIPQEPEEF